MWLGKIPAQRTRGFQTWPHHSRCAALQRLGKESIAACHRPFLGGPAQEGLLPPFLHQGPAFPLGPVMKGLVHGTTSEGLEQHRLTTTTSGLRVS